MPGMCAHPPTYTKHEKSPLGFIPELKAEDSKVTNLDHFRSNLMETLPFFSQNRFSVNAVWLGALVLSEGWDWNPQRKVITAFMMRMLFLTLDSIPSRKAYWRDFSLVSISGRMEPLQAIGFISLMNTMNQVCLLPWASEKHGVRWVAFPVKEAGFIPPLTPSHPSGTAFDFLHLLIFIFLCYNE